jgi:hypothetical protein
MGRATTASKIIAPVLGRWLIWSSISSANEGVAVTLATNKVKIAKARRGNRLIVISLLRNARLILFDEYLNMNGQTLDNFNSVESNRSYL